MIPSAPYDPFGTLLIMQGTVPGGLEDMRGSTSWQWLQDTLDNPLKEGATGLRKMMKGNLTDVMSRHQIPVSVPVLVLACSNETCGELYVSEGNPEGLCPQCGKEPL
jgi:hypothetical protein